MPVSLGLRLIFLILLAALPVFAIQIIHEIEVRDTRQAAILDNAETLAGLVAARQNRIVESSRLLLTSLSHLQSIRERNAERCDSVVREIATQVADLTAIAVLDPDGERWCVSLTGTSPLNLADREYFRDTLRTKTMQSSNFIIGRQTGEGSITFTHPVLSSDGVVQAVVFVAYRTSVLSRTLNEPPLPDGAIAALIDRGGTVAAAWPEPGAWMGKNLADSPIVQQATGQRQGSIRGKAGWWDGQEYAFAFAPMQQPTQLTVLVGLPMAAALRQSEALFWREVAWTSVIFLIASLVAIIGAHFTIARPLQGLRDRADRLARGDFEPPPSTHEGGREIQSLSKHLEAMARSLERRQSELVEAVQQKDLLLKEVNHRVKNNLQLIASLLSLQRLNIADPATRHQFDQAVSRINTVAHIHQRLYADERVDQVALDAFFPDFCTELAAAAADEDSKVTIECEAGACYLPTDKVIPLALIVNELVTNAFKYSYPGGEGVIRVTCHPKSDTLIVSVSDEGRPLPAELDPATSKGLGMRMIVGLARQIRARLEIVRGSRGKTFLLHVPVEGTAR